MVGNHFSAIETYNNHLTSAIEEQYEVCLDGKYMMIEDVNLDEYANVYITPLQKMVIISTSDK